MVFPKNWTGIWSFLYYQKKDDIYFFPKIWSYSLDRKIMIFFKKGHGNDIFCKCSEKIVFPKNSHWNMIFLQLSGKIIFLFPGNMIFSSNWYVQIFLYHFKLRFIEIRSVQVCALENAGDSIKMPLTRATKKKIIIINWSISFLKRAKNIFW